MESVNATLIEWPGGMCPVPAGTTVFLVHRDGSKRQVVIEFATAWDHIGTPCDIVAYRVINPTTPQPRTP